MGNSHPEAAPWEGQREEDKGEETETWNIEENGIWIETAPIGPPRGRGRRQRSPVQKRSIHMDESMFRRVCLIGLGRFSQVFLVEKIDSGDFFAMKVMVKQNIIEKNEFDRVNLHYAFQTDTKLFLVMQFANGGELYYHVKTNGRISENRVRFYISEIFLALAFLHRHNVVYRDLKLENILLDSEGHIVLADFNLSKVFKDRRHQRTATFCGTLDTLSPEVLLGKFGAAYSKGGNPFKKKKEEENPQPSEKGYSFHVDYWSLGVVAYEMLFGVPPFLGEDAQETLAIIMTRKVKFPRKKARISPDCKKFIRGCLQTNPLERLSAEGVLKHPWFSSLDWGDVYHRKIAPEFVPEVSGPGDTRYLAEEYTAAEEDQLENLSRCAASLSTVEDPFVRHDMEHKFRGFSFAEASPDSPTNELEPEYEGMVETMLGFVADDPDFLAQFVTEMRPRAHSPRAKLNGPLHPLDPLRLPRPGRKSPITPVPVEEEDHVTNPAPEVFPVHARVALDVGVMLDDPENGSEMLVPVSEPYDVEAFLDEEDVNEDREPPRVAPDVGVMLDDPESGLEMLVSVSEPCDVEAFLDEEDEDGELE